MKRRRPRSSREGGRERKLEIAWGVQDQDGSEEEANNDNREVTLVWSV